MKLAVVTISFNQAQFLERNRLSVQAQGEDVQQIFVDPGSTDGSREMIASWSGQPGVDAVLEPDAGPADGLNRGLSQVQCDLWLYLNADDELAPGSVARIVEEHRTAPRVDVLIGNGWTIDENGEPIKYIRSDRFSPRRYAQGVGTVLQQATSFKSRSTLGRFAFNAANRYNWDTEYLFDLHRAQASFGYSDASLGYFRLQPSSITMSGRHDSRLAAERARLIASVPRARLHRFVSPLARAAKFSRGKVTGTPSFGGLAR
ncbi:glycosyltransferase [Demequina rhizosphaerae]|uniref:glycosyltransferase n=1 Tax=Demequina rhizosphaerae TaxID=1638985 RepID=UPI0009E3184F|nr:glycosyltransferase [Demequina rhizosphaerae]